MSDAKLEFHSIYETFQPKVLRYMTNMVGESDAEDLTQEVFVKISRALKTFRGEASLSTWVYRIATNTALDLLRSSSFQHQKSSINTLEFDNMVTSTEQQTASPPESQVFRKEMNECICGLIEKLPVNYRMVLLLSEFEGLKDTEISAILGITVATAKIRLHRAREKMKDELGANCDSYWAEGNEFLPDLKRIFVK
jgi:RNA polymerase sigma-70 factor (ECF subfamily)